MRLGYFTMPMHPMHRNWSETLREDHEAIMLADKLGFHDCFVGEHLTDRAENITNSMIFLASLASSTTNIRLATGTTNLSHTHPVLVASHAAMLDHMTRGRFILGISAGALASDAEALGLLDVDRQKIFEESIDVIMEIWSREAPYDIDLPGNRFKVTTREKFDPKLGLGFIGKPFQQPRPEIVGTVVAPFSKGVFAMGARDFHPLSANFLLSKWLASHWSQYSEGKKSVGEQAKASDWRVARTVFVADDEATARRYAVEDAAGPYRFYYHQLLSKLQKSGRQGVFKREREQPDEDITLDYVLENQVIYGTVDRVLDAILRLREEAGDFGELVYAGMDWVDADLAKRSMQLMAEQVLPRVNAAIGA